MEKKSAVERTKGRRCSSLGQRGMTWFGEARDCGGWTGGGQKEADDDELLTEEGGVRRWWLRGWSAARQLANVAGPARGGWVSEAVAPVLGAAARQGRALGGCLRKEGSGEEAKGNSAPVWRIRGDKDTTHMWRRLLQGLCVERTWRAVDRGEVAGGDQATAASPRTRGRVLAGTRGHGLAWAAGKMAPPLF
jgi:hypothetical protein